MTKSKKKNTPSPPPPPNAETKSEMALALLRREGGASISEIADAMHWQPHSTRAVLTGFRKKGVAIDKAKIDGVTRYSVAAEPSP